jgi:ABC transport permease subunit
VRDWLPEFSTHARILGVESLPIGIFIALFTGIVLALLASYSVGDLVPPYFVGTLVQKTVTLELAPVLTGLALAGRVGANIAAELGTMRVTEQIDALETLTFDPMSHLVVPRVLASALMFPVVVGVAMLVGLLSGWMASLALLDISTPQFLKGVRVFFQAVGQLRGGGGTHRLSRGSHHHGWRAGRWAQRHTGRRHFGGDDSRARCLLGDGVAHQPHHSLASTRAGYTMGPVR